MRLSNNKIMHFQMEKRKNEKKEWLKKSHGLEFLHFIFKIFKVVSISQPRNIFMWLKCMYIIVEYEKQWNFLFKISIKNFDLKLMLKKQKKKKKKLMEKMD